MDTLSEEKNCCQKFHKFLQIIQILIRNIINIRSFGLILDFHPIFSYFPLLSEKYVAWVLVHQWKTKSVLNILATSNIEY